MVLKSASVLSCLFPARLGFGPNHKPDTRNPEKLATDRHIAVDRLGDPELDPFRGNPFPIYRSIDHDPRIDHPTHTLPSDSLASPFLPNGDVGESPSPAHRALAHPARQKRSSFTTFFAFSSKRRSVHGTPIIHLQQDLLVPPQAVPGRWVAGSGQVHLINHASIPSPLRTDEEEFYCSYYTSLTPAPPSQPTSPNPDAPNNSPSKLLSSQQQDLVGNSDLDTRPSSPPNPHPSSHTQIRHPYAYSTSLYSKPYVKTVEPAIPLRHATSQPLRHYPQVSHSGINAYGGRPSPQLKHETFKSHPHLIEQHELKTSVSAPNLASAASPVRPRSLLRKRPSTRSKGQDRWLSAESWWDALFSPSPRFKIKHAPRPKPTTGRVAHDPGSTFIRTKPNTNLGTTFPSISTSRPRAVSTASAISSAKPALSMLTRSRSTVDLFGRPSTSATHRAGFEPALETLVDQPTPPPDPATGCDSELPLPDPILTLEQVLDEGEAFEQQRARWKQQASKSLGNKRTRSFSRARSKSLGERNTRPGHHPSESGRAQLNLEFLAARTLLGSQSTMPTVHVTKPTGSSSHAKAYSHSHSHSAHSHTYSSHSRAYSHSHSHSLTTSHSSKSSRNLPPRSHSRNGSWSKTAFLKAGSLCGIASEEAYSPSADEKVPSSSRVDVQGVIHVCDPTNPECLSDMAQVSPPPIGEVGIAISSTPPLEGCFDFHMSKSRDEEGGQEIRCSSKHTHKSSEYAGPHPSAIDSKLPQLGGVSDISLRHRLPPRAITHPPITPIAHPYRSATAQPEPVGDKQREGTMSKVTQDQELADSSTDRTPHPHISLSHSDFQQYGVGEALVYASLPKPEVLKARHGDTQSESSPPTEVSSQEQSPCEIAILPPERRDSSSLTMNSVPSLTNSTIQMVMSAFDNPDALDEFQDLFYKPHAASRVHRREPSAAINHVPTDVHSSTASSPLTHLVRKLSEEVSSRRDPSRTSSDSILHQRGESQYYHSNETGTSFVFMDMVRSSSSPPPMESNSQLHVPIEEGTESPMPLVMIIPEDVNSSYTSSVLEPEDHENDTFGHPIRHGQLQVTTAPAPIHSPARVSTHLSIQEDETDDNEVAFVAPVTRRYGLVSLDAVRASYLTTSDMSQMSGLSDFPLPPSARPVSILQAYTETTTPPSTSESNDQSDDGVEVDQEDRREDEEEHVEPSDDVEEALRALRTTPRVVSYDSHRSTFGGSDDMDFITQLHQTGP